MSSHQANHFSFGTDGFRGIIARDFTYDVVRKAAQGMADYIAYKYPRADRPTVAVGYDRRFMSDKFALTLSEVLAANGLSVTLSSTPIPTPAISLLTTKGYGIGVVITASHNSHCYNGIKVKLHGRSAPPSVTADIENYVAKAVPMKPSGVPVPVKDFRPAYADYLNSRVSAAKMLAKLPGPVVVDFMYGAGAETAAIFNSKNVIKLRDRHDPLFGGISPEPVEKNLTDLVAAVKKHKALFGVALDGDADRFALVSDKGQYLTPCQTAPLLLNYLLSTGKYKGKVAQSVSMGYLTKRIAREAGLPFEETLVGFKYIAEKMLNEDVTFGVEESGGYTWKGNLPERDGTLTALFVMDMAVKTRKTVSALYAEIEKKYGKSVFIRRDFNLEKAIPNKHSFAVKIRKKLPKLLLGHKIIETNTIDGLKIVLDNDWWVLMRPSGTEPLLRTYAETDTQENTRKFLDIAFKLVEQKK
jgi:phosphomannomutase